MPMTLDARVTVPLSIVMIGFAAGVLKPGAEREYVGDRPLFLALRSHEGKPFMAHRMAQAWVHYGLLHALPAVIWSVLMPLQYWDYLRKKAPRLHRVCGYAAFSCSLLLSTTGILFIPFDLSWSNPMFEFHKVYGIPFIPSFNLALVTVAFPAMMITGFRALYLARQRRFVEHRRWTTYHGISGYLISIERVNILVTFIFGAILNANKELQTFLGSNKIKTIPQKSDAERAAFALTTWAAFIIAAGWIYHVRRSSAAPSKVKAE